METQPQQSEQSSSKGKQRARQPLRKRIMQRIDPKSLFMLLSTTHDPVNDYADMWKRCTHLIFDGLTYSEDGNVFVGCAHLSTSENTRQLVNPETYFPFLLKLCERYPHLQLIWALPPSPSKTLTIANIAQECTWNTILQSVEDARVVLVQRSGLRFDGVEINLTLVPAINERFV